MPAATPTSLLTYTLLGLALAAFIVAISLLLRGALQRPARQNLGLRITGRRDYPNHWFTLILQRPWYARALPLPRFQAGQSVAVSLTGAQSKAPLRRRYSLARWKKVPFEYEITIKPEAQGKLSQRLAIEAQIGTTLCVEIPSGNFILPQRPSTQRAVLIAGGVGITPLLAMLDRYQTMRVGEASSFQEIHLYWQVRFEHEWMYREALQQHALRDARIRVRLLASKALDGTAGRISIAMLKQELGKLSDSTFLMCASQPMLDDLSAGLQANGVAPTAIHFERFALGVSAREAGPWQLTIAGKSIPFQGHTNLLEALEDGGVALPSDCRTGTCGECRINVLAGLTCNLVQAEFIVPAGQVLACCCIPQSDLTLSHA
ncbi:MAG: 2Fe-2S iron-sulfur cluster-binding protein [Sideroxyarcus sp.]|nr:2Fe-2S iron-sulfur cluster-binding protein [Sideroxyarcus sp.]